MSTPMSVRLTDAARSRLNTQAELAAEPPARYAARLIDEGMRSAAHPGIIFRSTPTGGRVAALPNGPDVAEVIKVVTGLESTGDDCVRETAEWLTLPEHRVRLALNYYTEFTDEVDGELQRRAAGEERVRQQLERQQELLR